MPVALEEEAREVPAPRLPMAEEEEEERAEELSGLPPQPSIAEEVPSPVASALAAEREVVALEAVPERVGEGEVREALEAGFRFTMARLREPRERIFLTSLERLAERGEAALRRVVTVAVPVEGALSLPSISQLELRQFRMAVQVPRVARRAARLAERAQLRTSSR